MEEKEGEISDGIWKEEFEVLVSVYFGGLEFIDLLFRFNSSTIIQCHLTKALLMGKVKRTDMAFRPKRDGRKLLSLDLGWWGLRSCKCYYSHSANRRQVFLEQKLMILDREKILRLDAKRLEYEVVVIGEEAHLAYNRVGLTSFFQHRNVEDLYLNPKEWVRGRPAYGRAFMGLERERLMCGCVVCWHA